MNKPGKVLKRICKRLKVRLTVKRNGKRVYKSVKVLKEQCKKKKKIKKKKVKRKFRASIRVVEDTYVPHHQYVSNLKLSDLHDKYNPGSIPSKQKKRLKGVVSEAKKNGLSTGQIIGIVLGVIGGAGLFTGLGYYIGNQSKNKFGSYTPPQPPHGNDLPTPPQSPHGNVPPTPPQSPHGNAPMPVQSTVLDIDINNGSIRIRTDDGQFIYYNLQGNTGLLTQYINNREHVLALFNTYPGLGQVFIDWLHNFLTNTLLHNHVYLLSNDDYFNNNPGLEYFFHHWINIPNYNY